MKRYSEYKYSGYGWIGDIPKHWVIGRLKHYNEIIMGQSPSSEDYTSVESSLPFLQGNADFTKTYPKPNIYCETANKIAAKYDILISVRAPVGALNISDRAYGIGRGLAAVRCFERWRFNYYFLHKSKEYLNSIAYGSTFTAVSIDDIKNLPYLKMPDPECNQIANFLDNKTSQIDDLITKKQTLIELLKEERTAIINQAVTKGLDPNVPMKDSGIDWLGEIPEHWEVKKIKYIAQLRSGESITAELITNEGEYSVYGGNGIRGYYNSYTHDGSHVLIGRQGALCGNINYVSGKFWASEHAVVVSTYEELNIIWVGALLTAMNLNSYSRSAAQPGLSVEMIKNLFVPVPSVQEQESIGFFIEQNDHRIENITHTIEKEIELLTEYKTSLINEAVTGGIDVRDYETK